MAGAILVLSFLVSWRWCFLHCDSIATFPLVDYDYSLVDLQSFL